MWDARDRDLLLKFWNVAARFLMPIRELWYMAEAVASLLHPWTAETRAEFEERLRDLQRDAALLKLKDQLPIEELLAIRDRAVEGLRWFVEQFHRRNEPT